MGEKEWAKKHTSLKIIGTMLNNILFFTNSIISRERGKIK